LRLFVPFVQVRSSHYMLISVKKGLSFGLTSGIITTLGLIVGLNSGTHSQAVIISGILIIAIADSLSDAFGIHVSEESSSRNSHTHVWQATFATFISKFTFALSFIIPVLLLPLQTAIIVSIIWGLFLIGLFSYFIGENKKAKVVAEHLTMAVAVILITHFVGGFINNLTQ